MQIMKKNTPIHKRDKFVSYMKSEGALYVMLLLPLVYYLVFHYAPMYGVTIAFKDYNPFVGIFESEWVGFEVFKEIFRMKEFARAVRNTLMLNLMNILFGFPIPVLIAIMLNEVRQTRLKKVFQTVLYLPHFISWVIIGGLVYQIFSESYGMVNSAITALGMERVPFLSSKPHWIALYYFTHVWQSAGWGAIIYLAAITSIDPQLYEAAAIDGCGRVRMMWNITLPSIRGTVVTMFILTIGKVMNIGLDQPMMLGNVLVEDVSDVISTFVYRVGIQSGKFSVGTAVGLFQSVISIIMILISNTVANKLGEDGIW